MDQEAFNYNENATVDDESCIDAIYGCTSSNYEEYNPDANTNDGSCFTVLNSGCTDIFSLNYNHAWHIELHPWKFAHLFQAIYILAHRHQQTLQKYFQKLPRYLPYELLV